MYSDFKIKVLQKDQVFEKLSILDLFLKLSKVLHKKLAKLNKKWKKIISEKATNLPFFEDLAEEKTNQHL